jgi:hypothetical protein
MDSGGWIGDSDSCGVFKFRVNCGYYFKGAPLSSTSDLLFCQEGGCGVLVRGGASHYMLSLPLDFDLLVVIMLD